MRQSLLAGAARVLRFAGSRRTILAVVVLLAAWSPVTALAQAPPDGRLPMPTERATLSGPRFGVTFLGGSIRDSLRIKHQIKVGSYISQFGWQFEKQFLGNPGGLTAVSEWVLLIGGLDQGTFLPSASWLVGLRSAGGAEFGVGPNVTPVGVALAMAAGVTARSGAVNLPFTVAVVPSNVGVRVSLLTGFTIR